MKKLLISVFFITLYAVYTAIAGTYSGGAGSSGDPYLISTTNDLIELSNTTADWGNGSFFLLTNSIAFNIDESQVDWNDDSNIDAADVPGFSPIGSISTAFAANFNGQGFTIENLYINRPSTTDIGLFGYISNVARVNNIGVINADMTGDDRVGAVIGYSEGKVNNSYSTGAVSGNTRVGGFCGWNYDDITNCHSTCTVNGNISVGGLTGTNDEEGRIFFSYSTGNVSGNSNVGGIAGYSDYGGRIENCYSASIIAGSNYNIGGIVGENDAILVNCNYIGEVSGNTRIGGIVGNNTNMGNIANCYSIGIVSGNSNVGGIAGYGSARDIISCFWDIEIYASDNGLGTGKTTSQMKDIDTYTQLPNLGLSAPVWDFTNNPNDDTGNDDDWYICSEVNNGYPILSAFASVGSITTKLINTITPNSAKSGGVIPEDAGCILQRGIVWSDIPNAELNINELGKTNDGTATGEYNSSVTGLEPNKVYYVRAYASNSVGTFYGNEVSFATIPTLGEWGLIVLGTLTALFGGWFVYRKFV